MASRSPFLGRIALSLLVLVPRVASAHTGDPYVIYAARLGEAEDALQAGDGRQAVRLYVHAYESLPGDDRAADFGDDVVERVVSLAEAATARGPSDPEINAAALALIDRHLEVIRSFRPDRDPAEIEALRARIVEIAAPGPDLGASAARSQEQPPDRRERNPGADRRALVLGLTSAGVGVAVMGFAVLGYGAWYRGPYFRNDVAARFATCMRDDCRDDANRYRDRERRNANVWIATGAVATAVGVGMLATGIVLLIRDERKPAAVAVAPTLGMPGIGVSGRF